MISATRAYTARFPREDAPRPARLEAEMRRVLTALKGGATTTNEVSEATSLHPKRVGICVRELCADGHKIEMQKAGKQPKLWYLRPPGRQPCPECGKLMHSYQANYFCDACRNRKISNGEGLWPWEEI